MKTVFKLLAVVFLVVAVPSPCFALRSIAMVSKKDAREMGIEVRTKGNGPQVWVELEFKAEGKLKDFQHVEMEIREKEKFLVAYAVLKETRSASGSITVRFLADRGNLDKVILSVVVGDFDSSGYEIRVKDFVEPEKALPEKK